MAGKTPWTPGPYSVHPYSAFQTRKFAKDGSYEHAAITIGAGNRMLGEVRFSTSAAGYPCIESEAEMIATANLWVAAPELAEATRKLNDLIETLQRAVIQHLQPDGALQDQFEFIQRIIYLLDGPEQRAAQDGVSALLSRIEGGEA